MKIEGYYDTKLGCNNCGMEDFYKIPRGHEILAYESDNDADENDPSYSRIRAGLDDEQGYIKQLDCRNCRLPFLIVLGWEKKDLPALKKPVSTPSPLHK